MTILGQVSGHWISQGLNYTGIIQVVITVLHLIYGRLLALCGQLVNWSLLLCVHSATLLLKTDKSQAALFYRQLLERNPENSLYFRGLENALQPCE